MSRDRLDHYSSESSVSSFSIKGQIIFSVLVMGFLVFGLGAWAATAKLSSAVIAPASIVVERNIKKVQHRDGGIVSKILVKNGDRVQKGDVVVELDDTQLKAELGVLQTQLTELEARIARLRSEVTLSNEISFPADFERSTKYAAEAVEAEKKLFAASRAQVLGQKEQLKSQIEQLKREVGGLELQQAARKEQLKLIQLELKGVKKLYKKNLTSNTRLYSLQREAQRLSGEHGSLVEQIARTNGKISEIRLQILSIDKETILKARTELRQVQARKAELKERELAASDRLKRTKILAPQSGIVHDLAVHTVGGVVTEAEALLFIVPKDEKLTIEAKVSAVDIDQVQVGSDASIRFSAFNQQTTPEIEGLVTYVSADVSTDEKSAQQYYVAHIGIKEASQKDAKTLTLIPGMPVEVFISTGERTMASYILKPISDQVNRALREN